MDTYQAMITRRSIRQFKDTPVPYQILEKCIDAGRLAPCARNRQLCEYLIVNDDELVPGVFGGIKSWMGQPRSKGDPPPERPPRAFIIILINSALEAEFEAPRRITTYDVGLSAENIILAALEQGIGSCPILEFDESIMKPFLNVPDKYDIALVIPMGYPDEQPVQEISAGTIKTWIDEQGVRHVPKRKLEDIVHHNKFS